MAAQPGTACFHLFRVKGDVPLFTFISAEHVRPDHPSRFPDPKGKELPFQLNPAQALSRIWMAMAASPFPMVPPPFSAMAILAPSTCLSPASPLRWVTSS